MREIRQGRYVGIMSGTSADAADVVVLDIDDGAISLIASHSSPISPHIRDAVLACMSAPDLRWESFGSLDRELGIWFANAANELLTLNNLPRECITAIGSHGQTLRHQPDGAYPFTIQAGDPNTIAELTGITVVADFRRRDVAAGGQGAPLVPAFHRAFFGGRKQAVAVLNLGGIANLTSITPDTCIGFDIGPANGLCDAWHARHRGAAFDEDGKWATSGRANPDLLNRMLADPYFHRDIPKSTGKEYFNLDWVMRQLSGEEFRPEDVQATLLALTARSVSDAVRKHAPDAHELLVCGGGVRNSALMAQIQANLSPTPVISTSERGLDPQWVEAAAFAWLAAATLSAIPGNIPAVTGAAGPRVLGAIYHP